MMEESQLVTPLEDTALISPVKSGGDTGAGSKTPGEGDDSFEAKYLKVGNRYLAFNI
jgi:hypothetical protein